MEPPAPSARPSTGRRWLILGTALVVVGGGVFVGLRLLLADTGITACKTMAAYQSPNGVPGPTGPGIRADFAGSRYADLRTAGTAMIDLLNDPTTPYNDYIQSAATMLADYQNLTKACANHGVTLPPGGVYGDT